MMQFNLIGILQGRSDQYFHGGLKRLSDLIMISGLIIKLFSARSGCSFPFPDPQSIKNFLLLHIQLKHHLFQDSRHPRNSSFFWCMPQFACTLPYFNLTCLCYQFSLQPHCVIMDSTFFLHSEHCVILGQ